MRKLRPRVPDGRPVGQEPFRETDLADEAVQKAYTSTHDLREMYARDNTERRRTGSHTLRKHLTAVQDKQLTAKFVKIRDEYEVSNNDDAVLVFVQLLVADGKEADVDPRLLKLAKEADIPKRSA